MLAEIIGGLLSGSLALIGDAGHMFVDALALGLSLSAMSFARRPATSTRTYGYHRVEIMAAMVNGAILLLVTLYIFYEAYHRFIDPPVVNISLMIPVAIIGLVANMVGMLLLRGSRHDSLNVRAAFWHVLGDMISSVGVIVAGIVIWITGWYVVDPIIAIVIGCIILWGAVRLVIESVDILLEAVPKHIILDDVVAFIKKIPNVEDVHDIHIWTLTSGLYALSAHIVVEDQTVSQSSEVVRILNDGLAGQFDIRHSTLQIECHSCPSGSVCIVNQPDN
jgi:cobalt-zinc-cadmium efflux system protein